MRGALLHHILTVAYRTIAYEPPQALRDEIARLNGSGFQGGHFLRFQCKFYVTLFLFAAIVRVKEEQISKDHDLSGESDFRVAL